MSPEHWHKVCKFFAFAFRRKPAEHEKFLNKDSDANATLRASVVGLLAEHGQPGDESTMKDDQSNGDDATIAGDDTTADASTIRDQRTPGPGDAGIADHRDARPAPLFTPPGLRRLISVDLNDTEKLHSCPNCNHSIVLAAPTAHGEIVCTSCGSSVVLDSGSNASRTNQWRNGRYAGRFELIATVGTGGFGTVYKARDPQLDRIVALKVLRLGELAGDDLKDRFLREARNAAQLRHPAIVSVHEIGDESGVPFIVSDYIDGMTLSDWLTGRRPTFEESARLVAEIAIALDYAHTNGVIHRDVKPSNIMIDAAGRPHIMDFGLAKRDAGEITVTVEGEILGTPAYMSPEQARGEAHKVDGRSDVYSLGVVLYVLISGELPFRGNLRMLVHQVLNDEPRSPRSLVDTIPRDLETICLKAMAKEPARRYATAAELAADLNRFVQGEPILARPVTAITRLALWAQRNPRVAALSGAVYALLVLLAVGAALALESVGAARRTARLGMLQQNLQTGYRLLRESDVAASFPWFVETLRNQQELGDAGGEANSRIRIASIARGAPRAVQTWALPGAANAASFSPDGQRVVIASGTEAQIIEWKTDHVIKLPLAAEGSANDQPATCRLARFSPDGLRVMAAFAAEVTVWDALTGKELIEPLRHDAPVGWAAFSRDGKLLVTTAGRHVFLRDGVTGKMVAGPLDHPDLVNHVAFAPDGRSMVVSYGGPDMGIGGAWLWDLPIHDQKPRFRLDHYDDVFQAEYSPDGRRITTVSYDRSLKQWDAATGELRRMQRLTKSVTGLAMSAEGNLLMTVSGPEAMIWSGSLDRAGVPVRTRGNSIRAACNRDCGRIVTWGQDDAARVWDPATSELVMPPLRHRGTVNQAEFSPDGRYLVTASSDGTARVWDLAGGVWPEQTLRHGENVLNAALTPDGLHLMSISRDGVCKVWNLASPLTPPLVIEHPGMTDDAVFSPDGRYLATTGQDQTTRIWDLATGQLAAAPLLNPDKPEPVDPDGDYQSCRLGFSRDGRNILVTNARSAQVWDWRTRTVLRTVRHKERVLAPHIRHAAFNPSGNLLITTGEDTTARIWKLDEPEHPPLVLHHEGEVVFAEFSPDGQKVVTASKDRLARVWQVADGRMVAGYRHADSVNQARFSRDGLAVLSCSADHTAAVWGSDTGKIVLPLLNHQESVITVAFSPDGRLIATGCGGEPLGNSGLAQVWDAATGEAVTLPMRHGTGIRALEFSADGHSLVTAAFRDRSAKYWEIDRATEPLAVLERLAGVISGFTIDRKGGQVPRSPTEVCQDHRDLLMTLPRAFAASKSELACWLESEGRAMENAGLFAAAIACYDRLLAEDPRNPAFLSRRGEVKAWMGRWKDARDDMLAAVQCGADDMGTWYGAALICLKLEDTRNYEELRAFLLGRFAHIQDPWRADQLAFLCTLGPDHAGLMNKVVPMAQRLAEKRREDYDANFTYGAALFRAGKFDMAIDQFQEGIRHEGERGKPWHWLYLSMAYNKLGKADKSAQWLALADEDHSKAATQSKPYSELEWKEGLMIELLRREAHHLIDTAKR